MTIAVGRKATKPTNQKSVLFFHESISQDVAVYVAILRESVEAYVCRLVGSVCISVFVIASQ